MMITCSDAFHVLYSETLVIYHELQMLSQVWEKLSGVNIIDAANAKLYNPEELAEQLSAKSKTAKRIGFIGLGAMGFGMATHLLKSNFTVLGYDVSVALILLCIPSKNTRGHENSTQYCNVLGIFLCYMLLIAYNIYTSSLQTE